MGVQPRATRPSAECMLVSIYVLEDMDLLKLVSSQQRVSDEQLVPLTPITYRERFVACYRRAVCVPLTVIGEQVTPTRAVTSCTTTPMLEKAMNAESQWSRKDQNVEIRTT